jgi:hypothetical protein
MPCAGGNDCRVSAACDVLSSVNHEPGLAFLDPEELVGILVNFFADVFAFLKAHEDELLMLAGEENPAEERIVERRLFD